MSDMTALLNDLSYIPLNNEHNEPTQGDIGETSNEPTQATRNKFEELYANVNEELYHGCDYLTRLDFMAKFTYFKVKGKLTDSIFNEMLEFFQHVFPTTKGYKLSPSYYAIKKTFKTIGLRDVARGRIPFELFRSSYPGRDVTQDKYPHRQVARESTYLSLGIVVNVLVCLIEFMHSHIKFYLEISLNVVMYLKRARGRVFSPHISYIRAQGVMVPNSWCQTPKVMPRQQNGVWHQKCHGTRIQWEWFGTRILVP
ncbi:hypothetical protein Tco_1452304 [Tanacetum coccineum]